MLVWGGAAIVCGLLWTFLRWTVASFEAPTTVHIPRPVGYREAAKPASLLEMWSFHEEPWEPTYGRLTILAVAKPRNPHVLIVGRPYNAQRVFVSERDASGLVTWSDNERYRIPSQLEIEIEAAYQEWRSER